MSKKIITIQNVQKVGQLLHIQDSDEYIIAPEVENRENLEKYASIYFSFFFKKLNRNYIRQLKHLRQTYITREDLFVNSKISMQHSNYRTTAKHCNDRREIAKQMVKNGFLIIDKNIQMGTPVGHSSLKKNVTEPQHLDNQCGKYWIRTSYFYPVNDLYLSVYYLIIS